jgi:hypothetical protein
MKNNIWFSCRDPWVLGHRCMGKGDINYIEVEIDNVDNEEENHDNGSTSLDEDSAQAEKTSLPVYHRQRQGSTHQ